MSRSLSFVWRLFIAVSGLTLCCLSASEAQTLVFNPRLTTSVAGNGTTSYSPSSYAGVAASAGLNFPRRIAIDASGNLYWVEKGGNLARVLASGKGAIPALPSVASPTAGWVYTIAGNGSTTATCSGSTDGVGDGCAAPQAALNGPYALVVDSHGNVYLDDTGDYAIRVVYAGGTIPGLPASHVVGNVYRVAGNGATGFADGVGAQAQIGSSHGLAVDSKGNVYFADSGNQRIRVFYVTGTVPVIASPVAGDVYTITGGTTACASATSACGDRGPAISAEINGPDSVGVDCTGNIYFSDTSDYKLRAIYAGGSLPGISNPVSGDIYTVVGNGVSGTGP